MKKVKVLVQDKTTLILEEDGKRGDIIDLNDSLTVDQNKILETIKIAENLVYNKLLTDEKEKFNLEKENEILKLEEQYLKQLNDFKIQLQTKENDLEQLSLKVKSEKENAIFETEKKESENYKKKELNYLQKISNLEKSLEVLKTNQETNLLNEKQKIELDFQSKINQKDIELTSGKDRISTLIKAHQNEIDKLKLELSGMYEQKINIKESEIASLKERITGIQNNVTLEIDKGKLQISQSLQNEINSKSNEIELLKQNLNTKVTEHKLEIMETENILKSMILDKEKEIEQIKREKSSRNIKTIGEELENWCNEQFKSVQLFGFKTSKWEKDNTPVKALSETKGTKGDYIFQVFNDKEPKVLLASAMCEMKSESLEADNKKKNADHYKKLDDDRNKKNLQYAILISELEYNLESDAPIFIVPEYEKMYVVRPNYFITLLGIIESIGLKYSELVTQKELEKITFKESQVILDEFNAFKDNLLNNSVKHIGNNLESIKTKAENICKEANSVIDFVNTIVNTHLKTIQNKIEGYSIKSLNNNIKKIN